MSMDDRPRRTRMSPGERAAAILAAATALAREDGLAALTVRAVADRAGVAQGLVVHYFPVMNELVARIYSDLVGAEVVEVAAVLAAEHDDRRRIHALLATVLGGGRDDITVVWVEGWAFGRRNPALAEAVQAQMDSWHTLVVDVVAAGVAAGAFTSDDPAKAAWQILAMIDGLNAQSLVRAADAGAFVDDAVRAAETLLGVVE